MNKTTYANFYGVVNVFLGGGCVSSVLNVFRRGIVYRSRPSVFFHNYAASSYFANVE